MVVAFNNCADDYTKAEEGKTEDGDYRDTGFR
jgi:hypothetical protein